MKKFPKLLCVIAPFQHKKCLFVYCKIILSCDPQGFGAVAHFGLLRLQLKFSLIIENFGHRLQALKVTAFLRVIFYEKKRHTTIGHDKNLSIEEKTKIICWGSFMNKNEVNLRKMNLKGVTVG